MIPRSGPLLAPNQDERREARYICPRLLPQVRGGLWVVVNDNESIDGRSSYSRSDISLSRSIEDEVCAYPLQAVYANNTCRHITLGEESWSREQYSEMVATLAPKRETCVIGKDISIYTGEGLKETEKRKNTKVRCQIGHRCQHGHDDYCISTATPYANINTPA